MSLRAWWFRLRGTLRRDDALEQDMEREMAFHLEMSTERNMRRGLPPDIASRQARLAFGSTGAMQDEAREAYRARIAENLLADVRFALRGFRRAPAFALTAILTVALGIGASTAIFSVVDAVLLRPLPIPHPGDFAYLGWQWKKGGDVPSLTAFQFEFVRKHNRTLEAITTYRTDESALGAEGSDRIRGLRVGAGFFRTIGFAPRAGRPFDEGELQAGAPVVILGDAVWRTRFGADPSIVGRPVRLDGDLHTVIGVMPAEFQFPPAVGHEGYLVPFVLDVDPADEGHNTEAIARFRRGTTERERVADLQALSQAFRASYPLLADTGEFFKLFTHRDVYAGGIRRTVWLLFGAVSLLLLIACANTATLLLVRATVRQREIAVRASIGASRGRILQQLLTEGLVLSVVASALGVLSGLLGLRAFLAAAPSALPDGMTPQVDTRVLAFAVGVSIMTGLVFGVVAAIPSFRGRLQLGMTSASRNATGGGTRTRDTLVFLETTAAVVLLAGATLLATSFARLMRVDPGFDTDRVIAVRLGRLPAGYTSSRRDQLVDGLLERLRSIPGVEHVAAAPNLPLERGRNFPVDTRERPDLAVGAVELRPVSPGYFATLGIPLVVGRDFGPDDVAGGEPVAIVNEAFARRFWGDTVPIDRMIQIGHFRDRWIRPELERQTRVIGVVRNIHEIGLDRAPRPTVLVPRAEGGDGTPVLLVRGASKGLASAVHSAVVGEEPQLAPTIEPLSTVVRRSIAAPRFRMLLIGTFAGSALLLAGIGIYGVIASLVQQRTREIGIRVALGASRGVVALGVVRRCLAAVLAGAVAGLVVFWGVRQVLASMLYDTSTGDVRLLAIAILVLALVATMAAWIPARRAIRVDPAMTLRLE
ncbi:MAG TPA: ABC transporter permease [Gemmatimonadaceae bacterium]